MKIYRKGIEILDVELKKTSYTSEEINGQHIANVEFDIRNPVDFTIDDETSVLGERYYIRHKESIEKKESSIGYEYRIQFYHFMYKLFQKAFFPHGKPEFKPNLNYLRADARMILEVAVKCMNTNGETGWSVGEVAETKEFNFDYKDKSVGEVLNDAAKEFNLEMWVQGQSLNLGKREYSSNGLVLGQGEGFTSLRIEAVDDTPPITRLYAYGGDTNMGGEYVQLPGGVLYIEKNVDKYGIIEQVKHFDKIFPNPQFTITEKIDSHTFRSNIDFNLTDHLIENEDVLIAFQTGPLGGYEFSVVEGSWDNSTKQLKLKDHTDEKDLKLLEDIHFEVGNTFIVTNIKAPQIYKDNSSKDLLEEAQKYLDSKCDNRVQLRGECDEIEFAARDIFISCGQMVGVYDQRLGIDREIRAVSVKRFIEDEGETPYRYELTLSDFLSGNGFKEMVDAIKDVPKQIEEKVDPIKGFTKRTWQDVKETKAMMYDPESQFWQDIVSAIVGEFGQLIVGFQSAQMDFVGVRFQPNYNNNHNNFRSTAGQLIHNTINVDNTTRTWEIAASNLSLNNNNAYYIYARCPIEGDNGAIIASQTQIKLKDEPGFYHFWVGVLNTPRTDSGVTTRSWKPMYGFTEITGSDIVTGVIRDSLSRLIIDLKNAHIYAQNGATIEGAIVFKSGTYGYDNIVDKPDLVSRENSILNQANYYADTVSNSSAQYWSNQANITLREDLAKKLGYNNYTHLVNEAVTKGNTIVAGGYINTNLIDAEAIVSNYVTAGYISSLNIVTNKLKVNQGASIGAFEINSYEGLTWNGYDYFGNKEFSLALGTNPLGVSTDIGGIIVAKSSTVQRSVCLAGIVSGFGIGVYGSSDGYGSNFPDTYTKWAGFFSGSTKTTGDTQTGVVAASKFRVVSNFYSNGAYQYNEGVSFDPADYDLDNVRFRVRQGIIIGVTDDSGRILLGT